MKLSTKNIISFAILLASSYAHPLELKGIKGIDKAVQVSQEKTIHHSRKEFIEPTHDKINLDAYGPIFDIVCQSDISDWCDLYPEQCSYVKTLCVKNKRDNYCAFDIYSRYMDVTENNSKPMKSYDDLCDECLINMAERFQNVSNDEKANAEVKSIVDMCKSRTFMRNMKEYTGRAERSNNNMINALTSLIPFESRSKTSNEKQVKNKRSFGKIHSFKNPEEVGFIRPNGKIKYGHVGINEKVNYSIHNKNLRSRIRNFRNNKRNEEEEDVVVNIKEKINVALDNIKELALEKINVIFDKLEINVNVMLKDNLIINEAGNSREKDPFTDDVIENIKNILNNDASYTPKVYKVVAPLPEEPALNEDEQSVAEEETEKSDIPEVDEQPEELPPLTDVFENTLKAIMNEIPISKKSGEEIFNIEDEDDSDISVVNNQEAATEVATEAVTEGTEEEEEEEEAVPTDNGNEGEETEDEVEQKPEQPPVVEPEQPIFKPPKPSWPVKQPPHKPGHGKKPSKFGWKIKLPESINHHNHYHKPGILETINKLFENTGEDRTEIHMPLERWASKKSEYVVSSELTVENEENEDVEENIIEEHGGGASSVVISNHDDPEKEIKLNNLDNHRDTDEDEVTEIGSKKVTYVNNIHPIKPSLNFRENQRKEN